MGGQIGRYTGIYVDVDKQSDIYRDRQTETFKQGQGQSQTEAARLAKR